MDAYGRLGGGWEGGGGMCEAFVFFFASHHAHTMRDDALSLSRER